MVVIHVCITDLQRNKIWNFLSRNKFIHTFIDTLNFTASYFKWLKCSFRSADNKKQMWIPEGFAHGFLTLSVTAEFLYKTTDFYSKDHEQAIQWNDKKIHIDWPIKKPLLSAKDDFASTWDNAKYFS